MGGIYGGIFTPTEAAAVAAIYAFFIACFVYKDMGPLQNGEERYRILQRPQALVTAFFHADTQKTLLDAGKLTVASG